MTELKRSPIDWDNITNIDRVQRQELLMSIPKPTGNHPVFDRVAEKIGLFPPGIARDISVAYNMISSIRDQISVISEERIASLSDDVQIPMLISLVKLSKQALPRCEALEKQLRGLTKQSYFEYLMGIPA